MKNAELKLKANDLTEKINEFSSGNLEADRLMKERESDIIRHYEAEGETMAAKLAETKNQFQIVQLLN
jgi:hypothetical protein